MDPSVNNSVTDRGIVYTNRDSKSLKIDPDPSCSIQDTEIVIPNKIEGWLHKTIVIMQRS